MKQERPATTQYGFILLESYAGLTKHRVEIIGETPKKYRVRALQETRLAGRGRYILTGDETLVPKHAIQLEVA